MNYGYIKLYRRLQTNEMWLSEPFTRGQAWVDMILLTNHKDGFVRKRGVRVAVKRGQLGWSQVKLAERWGWSRGKVRRFFSELEIDGNIEHQKSNVTTLITLMNYDQYQTNGTADGTADGQQTDSKRYSNKKDKNVKNEKKDTVQDEVTEPVFLSIPLKKVSKDDPTDPLFHITESVLREFKDAYPDQDVEQSLRDIRMWNVSNPSRRKTLTGIMRHISTWLMSNHNKGKNRISRPEEGEDDSWASIPLHKKRGKEEN